MQRYELPRTGRSFLTFSGEVLFENKSPAHLRHLKSPTSYCHWFETSVYHTTSGKYILALRYRWAGKLSREVAQDFAFVVSCADFVIDSLKTFDPTACVTGYPEGDAKWDRKQEILMADIQTDYDLLVLNVSTQLASLQPAEEVD